MDEAVAVTVEGSIDDKPCFRFHCLRLDLSLGLAECLSNRPQEKQPELIAAEYLFQDIFFSFN
jgi:hypothetical protein